MLTVIPIWHTCFTCISRSRRGFFSMAPSTVSMLATFWLVRVLGEWGDPARCVFPPPGDRICDKISRKSSLKERARRASFPPRGFVFGVVLLSDSATPTLISHKLYDSISKWPTPPSTLQHPLSYHTNCTTVSPNDPHLQQKHKFSQINKTIWFLLAKYVPPQNGQGMYGSGCSQILGNRLPTKLNCKQWYLLVVSMELASCHHSSTYNFEVMPTFVGNMCIHVVLRVSSTADHSTAAQPHESLHPPLHPMTPAVLRTVTKDTPCTPTNFMTYSTSYNCSD